MSSRDVPEQWTDILVRAGMTDPRNGLASMTRLAEASGVHASTISSMMYGDRKAKAASVDKVADALSSALRAANPSEVRKAVHDLVGRTLNVAAPFEPHPDADLLTTKERQAVNELIRLLAAPKKMGTLVPIPTKRVPEVLEVSAPEPTLRGVAKEGEVEESQEFD